MKTKKLSRQRKYQIRNKAKGLCEKCGRLAFRAGECRYHYVYRAMRRLTATPQQATNLTKSVLREWARLEAPGPIVDSFRSLEVWRWIKRWNKKIGGKR